MFIKKKFIYPVISFSVIILIWEMVVIYSGWSSQVFPGPLAVFNSFIELIANGSLINHSVASLYRVTIGFYIGALLGVPLGIMLGLIVGKLVGVYGFSMAAIKMGFAKLPEGAANQHILGVAALCGIGLTMSLFVGGLAFEHTGGDAVAYLSTHRLGILTGSLLAGLAGYFILSMPVRKATVSEVEKVVDKEPPTVKL